MNKLISVASDGIWNWEIGGPTWEAGGLGPKSQSKWGSWKEGSQPLPTS